MINLPISKARLDRNLASGGFDVSILTRRLGSGDTEVMCELSPPAIQHVSVGDRMPGPSFGLSHESAQALLDALWEAGIRPSSGTVNDGAKSDVLMSLMKDHIADLRRMAFGQEVTVSADMPTTMPEHRF